VSLVLRKIGRQGRQVEGEVTERKERAKEIRAHRKFSEERFGASIVHLDGLVLPDLPEYSC
jgi:hypothetical protein